MSEPEIVHFYDRVWGQLCLIEGAFGMERSIDVPAYIPFGRGF